MCSSVSEMANQADPYYQRKTKYLVQNDKILKISNSTSDIVHKINKNIFIKISAELFHYLYFFNNKD